jgi:hypothetical protein
MRYVRDIRSLAFAVRDALVALGAAGDDDSAARELILRSGG